MFKRSFIKSLLVLLATGCSSHSPQDTVGAQGGNGAGGGSSGDQSSPAGAINNGGTSVLTGGSGGNFVGAPTRLDEAIEQIGQQIRERQLPLAALTRDQFLAWFDDAKYFEFIREEREMLETSLAAGTLPAGYFLEIDPASGSTIRFTKDLWRNCPDKAACSGISSGGFIYVVANGNGVALRSDWINERCSIMILPSTGTTLCDEPFVGPTPALDTGGWPVSVDVQVEPIEVEGEPQATPAQRDGLAIRVNLAAASIPALVDYFAVGYDRSSLESRLRELLGTADSRWVLVQDLLFGWVRERANTFPGQGDNDVCHGPARAFYYPVLDNYDRSTEAVAGLLLNHYCRVSDSIEPRFGDYLYAPARHSARYILRDPASHRDIVFSVQSGGTCPYRFWWADEDMSVKPFGHEPMPEYRQVLVDVWRRCH